MILQNISSVLGILRFFLRGAKVQVEIEAVEATIALDEAVAKLPEAQRWHDAIKALVVAEGWIVDLHPQTGEIISVKAPKDYVAPPRQSPQDFNIHQGD